MNLVPGKALAEELILSISSRISREKPPTLAIIQIGNEQASNVYIANKKNIAGRLGIKVKTINYDASQESEIETTIDRLNSDWNITGIIIQLPTPGIVPQRLLNLIDPKKDVDGLTNTSMGKVWHSLDLHSLGATPKAILFILDYIAKQENFLLANFLQGKNVLIINHSVLIGKPLAAAMTNYNATVTIANEYTRNLNEQFKLADIIVTATGQPIITHDNASFLKSGVVIIDSGYQMLDGKSHGDVDVEAIKEVATWLSPVPGGVGPIGVAMLMKNLVDRSESQR